METFALASVLGAAVADDVLGLVILVGMATYLLGFARRWALGRPEVLWTLVPTALAALWKFEHAGNVADMLAQLALRSDREA